MVNPDVAAVVESPIGETKGWLAGRTYPPDRPLLNVSQAVPGYPPPPELIDYLAAAVRDEATARYTPILGIPELRDALAADMTTVYGARMASENVGITAGCNQAFCVATMAVAEHGSEVIVPTPYYFNHDMWLRSMGVTPIYVPVGAGMVPDSGATLAAVGPRTRAVVLVTPNNPTGAIYSAQTIAAFHDLCRQEGLMLIVDETYRDFLPHADPPHDLFSDPQWSDTMVHLYSFSKVYSLTGYRVGAVVASERLLGEVAKLLDCITICPPAIAQSAALYGLGHLSGWRAARRSEMLAKIAGFERAIAGSPWDVEAAGGFFAYVRHPFGTRTARDVARGLLEDQSVLALSGDMFGPGQNGHLRLAFGNLVADQVDELVDRLSSYAAGV